MALFGLGKKKDPYHDHMMTLLVHKPDADKLPLVIDVETGETIAKSIAFTLKADARRIAWKAVPTSLLMVMFGTAS